MSVQWRALSLWQPWASLVALGVKCVETRSWSTSYRGPLAIHATKKVVHGRIGLYCCETWFTDVSHNPQLCYCDQGEVGPPCDRGATRTPCLTREGHDPIMLPLGAVVATCTLVDVVPVYVEHPSQAPYGDFTPGRYAWLLADIKPLAEPIPARGRQGLWLPGPDLLDALREITPL